MSADPLRQQAGKREKLGVGYQFSHSQAYHKSQKAVVILADRAKIKTYKGEILSNLLHTIKSKWRNGASSSNWGAKSDTDKM